MRCNDSNGKAKHFGNFKTPEEAFSFYKQYKEDVIKRIAIEEYSLNRITKKCFDGLMRYRIEITD